MTKPYKCKRIMIKVGTDIVGLVEGFASEAIREGGIEPHYCSETGKHAIGTRHITFSIRRWMYLDPSQQKLLFNLWKNKTQFLLYFGLSDDAETPTDILTGTELILSDCVGYRWRPVTGAAGDIVAEELVGEAVDIIDDGWTEPAAGYE